MVNLPLLDKLILQIDQQLRNFIAELDFGGCQSLREMIEYHMGWRDEIGTTGKRIRPSLVLLTTGACGGNVEVAFPAAAAVEFLHNFTLIHDDIEDNAAIRHGRQTLWKKWGLAQAINAGDALYAIAQLTMMDLGKTCDHYISLKAMSAFNNTCLHLTRGQYLDIAFESMQDVKIENYMDMIAGKTAALIGLTTFLGGLTTHQEQSILNLLREYGENLGMAFQIQDDYLGIWGDQEKTGKSAVSDLQARKKSLPILFGLQHSADFRRIWRNDQLTDNSIEQLTEILTICGAQDYVKNQAEGFTEQAFSALDRLFPEENIYSQTLNQLTKSLLQRNY